MTTLLGRPAPLVRNDPDDGGRARRAARRNGRRTDDRGCENPLRRGQESRTRHEPAGAQDRREGHRGRPRTGSTLGTVVFECPAPRRGVRQGFFRRSYGGLRRDESLVLRLQEREREAYRYCIGAIARLQLPMKLVEDRVLFEWRKAVFYFTAEGRVDFRQLVKELAHECRMRIEMRQIGVARRGSRHDRRIRISAGRSSDCASFLTGFEPISIAWAKDRTAALARKGFRRLRRLMCCLGYESRVLRGVQARAARIARGWAVREGVAGAQAQHLRDSFTWSSRVANSVKVPKKDWSPAVAWTSPPRTRRARDSEAASGRSPQDLTARRRCRRQQDRPDRGARRGRAAPGRSAAQRTVAAAAAGGRSRGFLTSAPASLHAHPPPARSGRGAPACPGGREPANGEKERTDTMKVILKSDIERSARSARWWPSPRVRPQLPDAPRPGARGHREELAPHRDREEALRQAQAKARQVGERWRPGSRPLAHDPPARGRSDRLFGTVTTMDIAAALEKEGNRDRPAADHGRGADQDARHLHGAGEARPRGHRGPQGLGRPE